MRASALIQINSPARRGSAPQNGRTTVSWGDRAGGRDDRSVRGTGAAVVYSRARRKAAAVAKGVSARAASNMAARISKGADPPSPSI